jgi:hypothetical protein
MGMIVRRVVLASLCSAFAIAGVERGGSIELTRCDVRGIAGGGRCGVYDAFENRSDVEGRKDHYHSRGVHA